MTGIGGGGTKPPIGSPSSKGPSIGGLFGGVTSPIVKQVSGGDVEPATLPPCCPCRVQNCEGHPPQRNRSSMLRSGLPPPGGPPRFPYTPTPPGGTPSISLYPPKALVTESVIYAALGLPPRGVSDYRAQRLALYAASRERDRNAFCGEHGQSLDWIVRGDPGGMICNAAARSARTAATARGAKP